MKRIVTVEITEQQLREALGLRPTLRIARVRFLDDEKPRAILRVVSDDDAGTPERKDGEPVPHVPLDMLRAETATDEAEGV